MYGVNTLPTLMGFKQDIIPQLSVGHVANTTTCVQNTLGLSDMGKNKFYPTDAENSLFDALFPSYVSFSQTILDKMRDGDYGKIPEYENEPQEKEKPSTDADLNRMYQKGVEDGKAYIKKGLEQCDTTTSVKAVTM